MSISNIVSFFNLPKTELNDCVLNILSIYIESSLIELISIQEYEFIINKILSELTNSNFVLNSLIDLIPIQDLYYNLPSNLKNFNIPPETLYGYYILWSLIKNTSFSIIIDTLVSFSSDEVTSIMFIDLFGYFVDYYNIIQGNDIDVISFVSQQNGGGSISFIIVIGILITFLLIGASFKTSQFLISVSDSFKELKAMDSHELTYALSETLPIISRNLDIENCDFLLDCIENMLKCCNNIITNGTKLIGIYNTSFTNFTNVTVKINNWKNKIKMVKSLINKTEERMEYKILTFCTSLFAQGIAIPTLQLINIKKRIIDKIQPKRSFIVKKFNSIIRMLEKPEIRQMVNNFIKKRRIRKTIGGIKRNKTRKII